MENTLCGPSNSLDTFKNHISVDRTLQQDRIGDGRPLAEGFRSSSATAGVLDLEFQAFQSGHSLRPGIPGQYQAFQSTHNLQPGVIQHETFFSHNFESEQVGLQTSSWAADFQNAQQASFNAATTVQAQYREQRSGVNFNHFENRNRSYINHNRFEGRNIHYATPPINLQNSKNPRIVDVSDDASLEQAFDAASIDLRDEEAHGLSGIGSLRGATECGQSSIFADLPEWLSQIDARRFVYRPIGSDQMINEAGGKEHQQFGVNEAHGLSGIGSLRDATESEENSIFAGLAEGLPQIDARRFVYRPIGSDQMIHEVRGKEHQQFGVNNEDELARTAGELLDNVKHEHSAKFRESKFLAFMGQLRDRKVRIEGDKVVDAVQSLHPGGAFYPDETQHKYDSIHGTYKKDVENPLLTDAELKELDGSSVSDKILFRASVIPCDAEPPYQGSPLEPQPPEPSSTPPPSLPPPAFSSLYFPSSEPVDHFRAILAEPDPPPAFCPGPPVEANSGPTSVEAETKAALPSDNKGEASNKAAEDGEPPPPYTEGSSPLDSFTYVMAATGGAASIITQVQQGGAPPVNTLADVGVDENITLDLRGTRFVLSRDELFTLPEFVLLSLFPNGLLPDGHMNSFHEGDAYPVDYDPASLQYMLDFFRNVAQTIPSSSPSPVASPNENSAVTTEATPSPAPDVLHDRAGIIVLREDLDFYAIPPKAEIDQPEMIEVKRAAGKALLGQDGIFSGLRRSEETGTTEQHLIEMLTAGGFYNDDRWGHRAGEPNKAVICSLALARLRTDIRGNDLANSNAVGMAQKLLLFWRKPARRCWWEGVELEGVDGVEGKLKVWIRRVWTLEMSVIGLR